jgi:hypothetical protein
MSGDKLPPEKKAACPRCERSTKEFAKPHCDPPSRNCTWAKCPCRATFDLYGSGSYHPDDFKEP